MTWYAAKHLVDLPSMPGTVQGIKLKANREDWQSRKRQARGGGKEYHITSLPIETQTELLKNTPARDETSQTLIAGSDESSPSSVCNQSEPVISFNYDKESLWAHFESKSEKQQQKAKDKLAAINTALSLINNGTARTKAFQAAADAHQVHMFTLRDKWYKSVEKYDRTDWLAALVPGYQGRTATAECDETAWSFFKSDYLRLEQPTAAACYRRLERAAKEHGWKIPSCDTFERRIEREIPRTTRVLLREGEQALYKLYPPQKRTVKDLHALEAINGDGYQHNVFVKWPDGEITRPKTWFWQDIHSRKILSYRVDKTENTDTIRLSFGDLVEDYGIPKHIVIDNTRAAANKWMTGGMPNRYRFKVKEDDPIGLFVLLVGPDNVHWTSVFNGSGSGQSKPVERAFGIGGIGEVVDKHPALAGSYTGNNPMAKPENYGSKVIDLKDFLVILEQEVIAWNARQKRRTEMCAGVASFDQVFDRSYENAAITKATEQQKRMWLLSAEAVKVQKDGTVSLDAGSAVGVGRNRYRSNALYEFQGQKVVVRFDPQQLHNEVFIYDLKGGYIDRAVCIEDSGFFDTQAAREHNRARKQMIKATKAAAKAEEKMTSIEAAGFLPSEDKPSIPDVKVVRPFKPVTDRKANNKTVVSVEERQRLAEEMQNQPSNVIETPRQKYFRWVEISEREDRTEEEQRFYETYQKTDSFRAERDICEEFNLTPDMAEVN